MLVVGSGKFAGYTLYLLTSDLATNPVCTATIVKAMPGGPGSCTGPSADPKAEWPAITTDGAPVAGAGVNQSLLGVVKKAGIGEQVTYAGYPLYLFDTSPGAVTGEGWDEPSLPPWHGVWWLVSPSGAPLAWPGTLTTTHIGGKTVLATMMLTGIGWEPFPIYSYSKDSSSASTCTGTCAGAWPPVLTTGRAALMGSLAAAKVSTVKRADGTEQLTYNGMPLYLFGSEGIAPQGMTYVATGNGNGAKVGGGTFHLVSP
jgi:predicted lipoprotein with Yx(FWY)xxD motif